MSHRYTRGARREARQYGTLEKYESLRHVVWHVLGLCRAWTRNRYHATGRTSSRLCLRRPVVVSCTAMSISMALLLRARIAPRIALVCLTAALALITPPGALAHGGHVGPTQVITQAIGAYELSITIEIPQSAPAPLYLTVEPHQNMDGATITLRAAPRGKSFASAPAVERRTTPPQPLYTTQLSVDRAGDWELEVQVDGEHGGVARIPFSLVIPPLPIVTILLLAAIGGLIVVMIL